MKKIRLAFDLDGILVDKPPLIPKKLLERLFKGKQKGLHYRFPETKIEQSIRKISHFYLFRPPIKKNIILLKKLARNRKYDLYLVSSRYSFLEKETRAWLKKKKINQCFNQVILNLNNQQPHLFKEKQIEKFKIGIYLEDDPLITDYLEKNLPHVKVCQTIKE